MSEYQNLKMYLLKDIHLIGVKKSNQTTNLIRKLIRNNLELKK